MTRERKVPPRREGVSFNGPFRTGFLLDNRKLVLEGYGALNTALGEGLTKRLRGRVRVDEPFQRASGLKMDVDTRRGVTILPQYLVEWELTGDDLAAELAELPLEETLKVLMIDRIVIRLHEFGLGAIMVDGSTPQAASSLLLRESVEAISSRLAPLNTLIARLVKEALTLTPRDVVLSRHADLLASREQDGRDERSFGKCAALWIHRVFRREAADAAEFAKWAGEAGDFVFRTRPEPVPDLSIQKGLLIHVGIGNSIIIHLPERRADAMTVCRVIRAQNVYWAKAADYDADLFFFMNKLSAKAREKDRALERINHLERLSSDIVDLLEGVTLFKTRMEDYRYHLDPQSQLVWRELSECWGTESRFQAIDNKLSAMERLYDRTRSKLQSLYDGQLNVLVFAFTLAGVLSVFTDVLNFVQGDGLRLPDFFRLGALIAMAVLMLFIVVRLLSRRIPNP